MASFLDTINGLSPVYFFRWDDLSIGPMPDSSANGFVGEYFSTARLGLPSPVETDPSSFSAGGPVGRLLIADAPDSDVRGNFTWIVFGYFTEHQNGTLIARNGQLGVNGGNFCAFNDGNITAEITVGGVTSVVSYSSANLIPGTFYMIRVTRNGTALKLHVNEPSAPNDQKLITGDPLDVGLSDGWYFGRAQSANTWYSERQDEGILFDYALTDGQALSILESALNSLSLTGISNVISSAILYSDIEPDPISFPFRHNWVDNWIERLSFSTGVSTAVKGYEAGTAQRIKPRREVELSQVTGNDAEWRMLRAKLNAHQNRKWLIPMLDDRERLAVPIASGSTSIPTDTLYKDYEVGGLVGFRQLNGADEIVVWEELLIGALADNEITTASPTINDYTNPEVYPVRRAILESSIEPKGHTDSVEEISILARLIAEDEKQIPHRIIEWSPSVSYKGYEAFPFANWPNNWAETRDYVVDRARTDVDYEVGSFVTTSDTNAAGETFSWRILLDTKQRQAEFLGWFYAHAGALNYLWVPSMRRDFDVVSASGDDLTVKGHNYSENFAGSEFRRDLAFIYADNSAILRGILSSVVDGGNEILTLDGSVPSLTNLRSVSYLCFCRLDNDTIERAATTDSKASFAWLFREMLSSPE